MINKWVIDKQWEEVRSEKWEVKRSEKWKMELEREREHKWRKQMKKTNEENKENRNNRIQTGFEGCFYTLNVKYMRHMRQYETQ